MRRTEEQKAETRQRIMEAAGRLFRQHGIDAVGVDCDHARGRPDAWRVLRAFRLEGGAGGGGRRRGAGPVGGAVGADLLRAIRRTSRWSGSSAPYLDPAHVAEVERGCVLTTLGPEVARRPEARPAIAASVRVMAEDAGTLPGWRRAGRRWQLCRPWWARSCWRGWRIRRNWRTRSWLRRRRRCLFLSLRGPKGSWGLTRGRNPHRADAPTIWAAARRRLLPRVKSEDPSGPNKKQGLSHSHKGRGKPSPPSAVSFSRGSAAWPVGNSQ